MRVTAAVLTWVLLTWSAGCVSGGRSGQGRGRAAVIREEIKKHLHYDLHCFCTTVTAETVRTVRGVVSTADLDVLGELLTDREAMVRTGASQLLVSFGLAAVPILEGARSKVSPGERMLLIDLPLQQIRSGLGETP